MHLEINAEKCTGCRICENFCSFHHEGAIWPARSRITIVAESDEGPFTPNVCRQCKDAPCVAVCPVNALSRNNGIVKLDPDLCISCFKCVEACPFGAIYAHEDCPHPIKCDMCSGDPECVRHCPKEALRLLPEEVLGETRRLHNILSYAHMKEIEFYEKGEKKVIHYTEVGKEEL